MTIKRKESGNENMKEAIIISGFPGVGKSTLMEKYNDLNILDSDASKFAWVEKGVRDLSFPQNYIEYIKANIQTTDVILVSSHESVRSCFKENNISYYLVYPFEYLMKEYINRYKNRGNDNIFIANIKNNWDSFMKEMDDDDYPLKIRLTEGQYLSDVLQLPSSIL